MVSKNRKINKKNASGSVAKVVKSILDARTEVKTLETFISTTVSTASSQIYALTQPIIQGDTGSTRDGDQIFMKYFELTYDFFANPSGANVQIMRVIVFGDTMAWGASIADISHILASNVPSGAYSHEQISARRFTIYHDKLIGVSVNGPAVFTHRSKIHVNKRITFSSTDNADHSNGKNAMYVMFVSGSSSNLPSVNLSAGLRFTDI